MNQTTTYNDRPFPTPNPSDPTAGWTARRTPIGSKPAITVYGPDGAPVSTLGGNRAARANYVLMVAYGPDHGRLANGLTGPYAGKTQIIGLRAALVGTRQVSGTKYGQKQDYVEFGVPVTD